MIDILRSELADGSNFGCYCAGEEDVEAAIKRCVKMSDIAGVWILPNGFTFRETCDFIFVCREGKLIVIDYEKNLLFSESMLEDEVVEPRPSSVQYREGLPEIFICSICLEPMKDPHVNSVGEMYCKECLLSLFESGDYRDPRTRQRITGSILPCRPAQREMKNWEL